MTERRQSIFESFARGYIREDGRPSFPALLNHANTKAVAAVRDGDSLFAWMWARVAVRIVRKMKEGQR